MTIFQFLRLHLMTCQSANRSAARAEFSAVDDLQVSQYDRTNAAVLAMILVAAAVLLIQLLIGPRNEFSRAAVGPTMNVGETVELVQPAESQAPDASEFPEAKPSATLVSSLRSIRTVVNQVNDRPGSDESRSGPFGIDYREPPPVVPPINEASRWKVQYQPADFDQYCRQLAALGVELGVVSEQSNRVVRISLPAPYNVTPSDRESENQRGSTFFVHHRDRLKRWDQKIATDAGVSLDQSFTVQFYPEAALSMMRAAEMEELGKLGASLEQVQETRFKIEPLADAFVLRVDEILLQ